jgi:DNA invertase Pin-like site-specific DNA recombinase
MTAIIYTRVSTEEQAESGAGLNAQFDACAGFVKQQGWTVSGVYSDEGVSGTADVEKRAGLMRAIDALGKGDVLVVAKRDRLGRDVVLVKMIERLVAKRKASIHALNGATGDSPEAHFMNGILDLSSAYEVALIRARTKAALQAKRARNERMGKLPFGFTTDDGVHLVPCAEEQSILHRINTLRQEGYSLRKVADALNSEGRFNRQGLPWNHVSLHTLCKDLDWRLAA